MCIRDRVRAYSGALKEGLKACVVVEKKLASCLEVRTDYNLSLIHIYTIDQMM